MRIPHAILSGVLVISVAACSGTQSGTAPSEAAGGSEIKVGLLHSLSGTMAISEVTVRDAELLAIEEINKAGGVLGKKLVPVVEDGASDWPTFAEKATKLIRQDKVATVFGGWTSASRKAMLPVFERYKALLWYPVQYEGLESSPYIFYTGATTNQQIIPGLDYLKEQGKKKIFLVGSDYVFPRTANKIIKAYAAANGMEILGEEYTPLGHTEYSTLVNKVTQAKPEAVFNTLNGDSNVAFFKQLKSAGATAESMPVLSVSIAEEEVKGIGVDNIAGQPVAWNYYQTTDNPANTAFVKAFKDTYGQDKVTSDPMEAGYNAVYLWAEAAKKAGTVEVEAVKKAAGGIALERPEGLVTIDGETQHMYKTARIGIVQPDGLIKQVWDSGKPIKPDPYLKGYPWASGLAQG
ncbi:urea ABC transporter substrate-binding protein [Nonomuraea glycinis]|uniref:Urea ABC transporter substrate-binding protein n=1 Tax=Nonomuraea glycinis TaxID=2047744 RepID=A0A918AGF8_9ACTN|nr:urea ABC transporter substrate-binding protein [Nonomuraea glycinis]MCA2183411.1 urea ABC transporter substrate-binding protein [Nonomuraea glycinis]GGP18587.1 urea ABC transporter substrate-binding protein [Nonomuraea glycinis]